MMTAVAKHVVQALHHRGPDAQGIRSWPEATLVHTRLSIIDLSPTGAQPMANEDGTVWTDFNREIYDHPEHRRTLKPEAICSKGARTQKSCPTLSGRRGGIASPSCVACSRLAIYDARTRTSFWPGIVSGLSPCFMHQGRPLLFASEIRALLETDIDDRPNKQAIYDFAALSTSLRHRHSTPASRLFNPVRYWRPGWMPRDLLGKRGLIIGGRSPLIPR